MYLPLHEELDPRAQVGVEGGEPVELQQAAVDVGGEGVLVPAELLDAADQGVVGPDHSADAGLGERRPGG